VGITLRCGRWDHRHGVGRFSLVSQYAAKIKKSTHKRPKPVKKFVMSRSVRCGLLKDQKRGCSVWWVVRHFPKRGKGRIGGIQNRARKTPPIFVVAEPQRVLLGEDICGNYSADSSGK